MAQEPVQEAQLLLVEGLLAAAMTMELGLGLLARVLQVQAWAWVQIPVLPLMNPKTIRF